MKIKPNTNKSSEQLRGIALFVLVLGIVIAALFMFAGVMAMMNSDGASHYGYYRRNFLDMIISSIELRYIFISILIFFYHYVAYVMISAYATAIENLDRTDVVEALLDINDTLNKKLIISAVANSVNRKPSDKKINNNERNENPVDEMELEKIDISGINEE